MTKIYRLVCVLLIGTSIVVNVSTASTRVSVVDNQSHLRAFPSDNADIVSTATKGTVLTCLFIKDGWLKIVPSPNVDVWIYSELLVGNTVAANTIRLRSGPGISFPAVGELKKGDVVTRRGSKGDWLKIAAPKSCGLWLNAKHVKSMSPQKSGTKVVKSKPKSPVYKPVVKPAVKKPVVRQKCIVPVPVKKRKYQQSPVVKTTKPPVLTVVSTVKPDEVIKRKTVALETLPIDKKRLITSAPQGESIKISGVLHKSNLIWKRGINYRLVGKRESRSSNICYLTKNSNLSGLVGQKVIIHGRKYWLHGFKLPVIVPSSVSR